jgi:hypothetical protein
MIERILVGLVYIPMLVIVWSFMFITIKIMQDKPWDK